ncbi:hypothetical protein ORQ98_11945 [Spartinivicinus sp. A2-2]|uniref:Uncharacterized protein n=1 Tax=Spartinivicinus poritis TaxID=2994640 RepID=A0ABT5U8I5_9GAMM|nr:hypothetical protein [Spartinivicinus sp. A2-2]
MDNSGGGEDWVFFKNGITKERLSFIRDGDDLLIHVDETSQPAVKVLNHFKGDEFAISYVQPDGGWAINANEIAQLVVDVDSVENENTETNSGETDNTGSTSTENEESGEENSNGNTGTNEEENPDTGSTETGNENSETGSEETNNGEVETPDNPADYDNIVEGDEQGTQLLGSEKRDFIRGNGGDDEIYGFEGDDKLLGGEGNDRLSGGNGYDIPDGNDILEGGTGNDRLFGNNGNDHLVGGADNDRLDGGSGDDHLIGGIGDDVYFFSEGHDVIDNQHGGLDSLVLPKGLTEEQIIFKREDDDLLISIEGRPNDSARIVNHFLGGEYAIDEVYPNGGTIISAEKINQIMEAREIGGDIDRVIDGDDSNNGLWGSSKNELIRGKKGDDQLAGHGGDDILIGGEGDDLYFFTSGNDVIDNQHGGREDRVQLPGGLSEAQMSFIRDNDDLVIKVAGQPNDSIRVLNHFKGGEYQIDYVYSNGGFPIYAERINELAVESTASSRTERSVALLTEAMSSFADNRGVADTNMAVNQPSTHTVITGSSLAS